MQITEKELIQIISEEIDKMVENDEIDEGVLDRLKAQAAGATATLNPFASQGDAALKKAASTMSSYSNHLLKLQQKLAMDAQKLGIDGVDDIQTVSKAIGQTQQKVQNIAKTAPRSEKFKAAVQRAVADQSGGQQQAAPAAGGGQQQAAPAAAEPAASPAASPAAEPAAAQSSTDRTYIAPDDAGLKAWVQGGKGDLPPTTSHRTITRRSRMGQKDGKTVFNSNEALALAKQFAQQFPDRTPSPLKQAIQDTEEVGYSDSISESSQTELSEEAYQQFIGQINEWERQFESKGETLNEQLQEISRRWGFGK